MSKICNKGWSTRLCVKSMTVREMWMESKRNHCSRKAKPLFQAAPHTGWKIRLRQMLQELVPVELCGVTGMETTSKNVWLSKWTEESVSVEWWVAWVRENIVLESFNAQGLGGVSVVTLYHCHCRVWGGWKKPLMQPRVRRGGRVKLVLVQKCVSVECWVTGVRENIVLEFLMSKA